MSGFGGQHQDMKVTTGYLNTVNDPAPGVVMASPSGSIVSNYAGQVGGIITLSAKDALKVCDTSIGTLKGGDYQYVKFLDAPVKGGVMFWNDYDNFIVTMVASATNIGKLAGIALSVVTAGQYGFIQVTGKATVKFKASLTKVAADGDLVVVDQTPAALGDVLADATALTSPIMRAAIGTALEAPTDGGLKLVQLRFPPNRGQ